MFAMQYGHILRITTAVWLSFYLLSLIYITS